MPSCNFALFLGMISQDQIRDYVDFPSLDDSFDGVVCVGGDLAPEVLITAYRNAIFPWYNEGEQILWWSPEKRCVVKPGAVKVSKSMRPLLNSSKYTVSMDTNFSEVISSCRNIERPTQDGTWIVDEMETAYNLLYSLGLAHSIEVKDVSGKLVGGLYGVSLGKMFYGESMFSKEPNTSKLGFIHLSQFLVGMGFDMIDCQVQNPHLERMGCVEISREEFVNINECGVEHDTQIGSWESAFNKYWINR